jgi:predicted DNA-binding transcriptional regulator AlpA
VEPLVTTRQLAELWCQTPRWVLRMGQEQGLPRYLLGSSLRYRISEVEAWLQQHHDAGTLPPAERNSNLAELQVVGDARTAA